jgi:aminopeptidase-like protein
MYKIVQNRMNLLAYSDGETELIDIANILRIPIWELYSEVKLLCKFGLLERC